MATTLVVNNGDQHLVSVFFWSENGLGQDFDSCEDDAGGQTIPDGQRPAGQSRGPKGYAAPARDRTEARPGQRQGRGPDSSV